MLIGNIFQQAYTMADTVIVGRFINGEALAAVGTAGAIINFLLSVLIGLTTGASVLVSQFYGAKEEEYLNRTVSTSIIFMGAFSIVISLIGVFGASMLLKLINVPSDVFDDAKIYLQLIMGSMIFPMFYNVYTAYMRALGDSKRPLYILILATILNVILDIIFVAYFKWGIPGAAWATIFSQIVAFVLCYLYAIKYLPLLRIKKLIFDVKLFKAVLKYSVPAAIQLSITSLASLTITRLINSFGAVAVAGYTAATRIDMFAMMPLNNLSMATSTFVAQNIGAGLEERAQKGFRSAMLFMVGIGIFVSALAVIFGKWMIGLFVDAADPSSTEIIRVGTEYLSIIAIFYVLFAVFFSFNGFFRGAGDAVIVMILTITSLTIRTVSAHILVSQFGFGPEAVAWSIPIGWGLCGLFAFIYYKKRMWVGKAVVNREAGSVTESGE
jgi:putative MATE family efflux protein